MNLRLPVSLGLSALVFTVAASAAHANTLSDARVNVTCSGYQVDFTAVMIPNQQGKVNYQIVATPVGPGSTQGASGSVVLPINTLPYGAPVSASGAGNWMSPLVGTFDITGSVQLDNATSVYLDSFVNQPVRITCSAPPPAPVCGNGVVESGEQCDDGNRLNGDGCSASCQNEPPPPPKDGEGCTPGYWKQIHPGSWVKYSPNDSFAAVFDVEPKFSVTLSGALRLFGGGEAALARHAVAALLNAANPKVKYAFTEAEVIDMVQDAYKSGDFEGVKDLLAAENERGCPLPGKPDRDWDKKCKQHDGKDWGKDDKDHGKDWGKDWGRDYDKGKRWGRLIDIFRSCFGRR